MAGGKITIVLAIAAASLAAGCASAPVQHHETLLCLPAEIKEAPDVKGAMACGSVERIRELLKQEGKLNETSPRVRHQAPAPVVPGEMKI